MAQTLLDKNKHEVERIIKSRSSRLYTGERQSHLMGVLLVRRMKRQLWRKGKLPPRIGKRECKRLQKDKWSSCGTLQAKPCGVEGRE